MDIPRSTYYYKPKKKLSGEAELRDRIEKIAYKYPYYGYRRMTHALKRDSIKVNHKKVLKIMKEMGIQCRKRRKFAVTTNSSHKLRTYPNLAKELIVERVDQLWCADITYCHPSPALNHSVSTIEPVNRNYN